MVSGLLSLRKACWDTKWWSSCASRHLNSAFIFTALFVSCPTGKWYKLKSEKLSIA